MINLLIIQGCQSGSVGRGGQLVRFSGWSSGLDGPGSPGSPGSPSGPGGRGGRYYRKIIDSR